VYLLYLLELSFFYLSISGNPNDSNKGKTISILGRRISITVRNQFLSCYHLYILTIIARLLKPDPIEERCFDN